MIHFLLVPDSAAAMKLRRSVAEAGGRTGVLVGTWPELLRQALRCHILPPLQDEWGGRFTEAAAKLPGAFWEASFAAVNPGEKRAIASVLEHHLTMLLEAAGPDGLPAEPEGIDGQPRLQRRIRDLVRLHEALGFTLPPHLLAIRRIIDAPHSLRIDTMRVYRMEGWPELNPWQLALAEHLNATAGDGEDPTLREALEQAPCRPSAPDGTALRTLQEKLFTLPGQKVAPDGSLRWLKVRDHLQEAEVAAGMVQKAMKRDTSLRFADFGLLLPSAARYARAVREVFDAAGIPVSGLDNTYGIRDLGGEAVLNLLYAMERPSPVIALAALLSSPLMPWDADTGSRLAMDAVELRREPALPPGAGRPSRDMLELILNGAEDPAGLKRALLAFPDLLGRDGSLAVHRERAGALCREVALAVDESDRTISWPELHALVPSEPVEAETPTEFSREGVAVFREGNEAWRTVRRLIVLGCSDGHHPAAASGSVVFRDEELHGLKAAGGPALCTSEEEGGENRRRFLRQLSAATESATFLLPGRDGEGNALSPSSSVAFATALLDVEGGTEGLVLNLESREERKNAEGVAVVERPEPVPPKALQPEEDIEFRRNLLKAGKGEAKPDSPSRLDTLLASPLAWLLDRLGVKPREWKPETLDVLMMGTLAHAVFEQLFTPEGVAAEQDIPGLLPDAYGHTLKRHCPFLLRPEWKIERENLMQSILKAALEWSAILADTGAKVAATEIGLKGDIDGYPIHGNADLLLELPGGKMAVVDYKKSGSTGRRERMAAGYDLQTSLYRTMIGTGGAEYPEKITPDAAALIKRFRSGGEIAGVYYTMNDRTALSDTAGWFRSVAGIAEMGTDISKNALDELGEKLERLAGGTLELNRLSDEKALEKKKIPAYALKDDGPPLVRLFMKPEEDTAGTNDNGEDNDD